MAQDSRSRVPDPGFQIQGSSFRFLNHKTFTCKSGSRIRQRNSPKNHSDSVRNVLITDGVFIRAMKMSLSVNAAITIISESAALGIRRPVLFIVLVRRG